MSSYIGREDGRLTGGLSLNLLRSVTSVPEILWQRTTVTSTNCRMQCVGKCGDAKIASDQSNSKASKVLNTGCRVSLLCCGHVGWDYLLDRFQNTSVNMNH